MYMAWSNPWIGIACGICMIAVGVLYDSSVFLGNPTGLDWIFDPLAVYFIVRGIWDLFKKKEE